MNNIPKLPLRFFRWYCHPDFAEDIEGDLMERFEVKTKEKNLKSAKWGFSKDVIRLFRPGIIRPLGGSHQLNNYGMFKNYMKISWRSLLNQKLYSAINIGGLAVGLTCFIMVFLYVQHELSYDQFYNNSDQIYRVYQKQDGNISLGSDLFAETPAILAPKLTEDFAAVEYATAVQRQSALLSYGDKHYSERGLWGDAYFFNVFELSFISGNPQKALAEPESIVLTESLAGKIFGDKDPMGQELTFRRDFQFTVTGVIRDLPETSSLKFSYLTGLQSNSFYQQELEQASWHSNVCHTFLKVSENANPASLETSLQHMFDGFSRENDNYPFDATYYIQPLNALHLETNINGDIGLKGNSTYVKLFSLVAILVLLLACINYINLAIARSIKRTKEVGLRKVVGAGKWQLTIQFLSESILIALIALVLALVLTYWLLPIFSSWIERPLELELFSNLWQLPSLLIIVIMVGIISGSYPAFIMSSLKPVQAFKGKISNKFSGIKLQQMLVVGQYAAAIVLIISSLVIYQQFQFVQRKELGYEKEHIIAINIEDRTLFKHLETLQVEWSGNPNIIASTTTEQLPTYVRGGTTVQGNTSSEEQLAIHRARIDYDFLDVFNIELIAGRNFSPNITSDRESGRVINETAAKALGWTPEEAIGQQFYYLDNEPMTVVGVVKDFHMHSLHMPIKPLMMMLRNNYVRYVAVKVHPENITETLTYLEGTFQKYSPYPFDYQFLDEHFDQLYKAEIRAGEIFGFFTIIAIIIASIGLFGLAAYSTSQRTKEIGIRKVLGATVSSIITMLSKEYLKLAFLGFLISIPIAWYAMDLWLQDFAYRINIELWMFASVGLIALVISLLTVGSQSIKASMASPVNSLKNE